MSRPARYKRIMPDDPIDPFEEDRKRKRLFDEAMGGSARRLIEDDRKRRELFYAAIGGTSLRFFEEDRKRRKMLDDAMGGSVQRIFEEEQKRQKLFDQSAIGKAALGIIDRQKEQDLLQPFRNGAIKTYFDAEDARRKAFDVGSLASAKAFQYNIASTIAALAEPYTKLSKQMRDWGVLDRIAEQQSALIKASTGINSQIEALGRTLQGTIPNVSQISASFRVQSALAEQMRHISEQFSQLDRIALTGGIRDSAVWHSMRDTYGLSNEMSVSQAFLEIGTQLDKPVEGGKSFGVRDAWQLIEFLWLIFSAYAMIAGWGDYTEDDRARDKATSEAVDRFEARQRMDEVEAAIAKASALAEMARINDLPKGYVRIAANVRVSPEQKAARIARLGPNTTLAIENKQGRWLRVIYADPLTDQLAEGWLWGDSVELLSNH